MRKIVVLLCFISVFVACKKAEKTNVDLTESVTTNSLEIEAEFIYIQDAAVLKGQSFIYGVVLDDKANELAKEVKAYKKNKYDMVPVVVKGIVKPNPLKNGWKEVVEIKEIVKISPVKEDVSQSFKVSVNQ